MGTEARPADGAAISSPTGTVSLDDGPADVASSQPSSASQSFEFVLVNDEGSRRQVRRHAMRQYMRQRRLDGISRLGSSRTPTTGWTSPGNGVDAELALDSQVKEESEDVSPDLKKMIKIEDSPARATCNGIRHPESSPNWARGMFSYGLNEASESSPLSSPSIAGMRDPFDSYPMPITEGDHRLIHHYVVTYPAMMYKLSAPGHRNPMTEIFQQFALQDRVPFQTMLAIASKHLASMEGKSESVQSLAHKTQALQLINRQIQTTTEDQLDKFIYPIATLAVIEKWSKDSSIERMHFKGLTLLIRRTGGMRRLKAAKPFLEQVVYWVDFSCAPNAIVDASLPWTGDVPDSIPDRFHFLSPDMHVKSPRGPGVEPQSAYSRACEEFLTFFRCLHAAERVLLKAPFDAPSKRETRRAKLFDASSRLYGLLTTIPDYDHGVRDVRFIDEYTCLACLLYLNVALLESYSQSQNFDHYLRWLDSEARHLSVDSSISSVMWLLLDNGGYPRGNAGDSGERSWLVSRMLRVAKRLEWNCQGKLWDRLRLTLIRFIATQQQCGLGTDNIGEEEMFARRRKLDQTDHFLWDEDEMRREILGNLHSGTSSHASGQGHDSSRFAPIG